MLCQHPSFIQNRDRDIFPRSHSLEPVRVELGFNQKPGEWERVENRFKMAGLNSGLSKKALYHLSYRLLGGVLCVRFHTMICFSPLAAGLDGREDLPLPVTA